MAFTIPQRGIVTPGGFKPLNTPATPPLTDEAAERVKILHELGGYLDGVEIGWNDILVAKYIPTKLGSLTTSRETQQEQRWQNKCGMVLKFGPKAKDDGFLYEAGDWVYYRPSDGCEIGLRCENSPSIMFCLLLSPAHIIGKVKNPDLIW